MVWYLIFCTTWLTTNGSHATHCITPVKVPTQQECQYLGVQMDFVSGAQETNRKCVSWQEHQ